VSLEFLTVSALFTLPLRLNVIGVPETLKSNLLAFYALGILTKMSCVLTKSLESVLEGLYLTCT
jgi:hypothetical protein